MTDSLTNAPHIDALARLRLPDPSPMLTILRAATEKGEQFTLKHEAMDCPKIPPAPERIKGGRRAHAIETLTDLKRYVAKAATNTEGPICFYSDAGASVVLDHLSDEEKEVIRCTLERHPQFEKWCGLSGSEMTHAQFMQLLREHGECAIGDTETEYAFLVATFASLTGTLTHDADEYLDNQARSANFIVKRKTRGGATEGTETEIPNVPTEFNLRIPVLMDDTEKLECKVLVRMTGAQGGGITFTLIFAGFEEAVTEHINKRLQEFADSAGFLCVRGQYIEQPWSQPKLPESIMQLMELQTKALQAMAANRLI